MCEVIINNITYIANTFKHHFSQTPIRLGKFRGTGRVTNAITFTFNTDMSFLGQEKTLVFSSSGTFNIDATTVLELIIDDQKPNIVKFIY